MQIIKIRYVYIYVYMYVCTDVREELTVDIGGKHPFNEIVRQRFVWWIFSTVSSTFILHSKLNSELTLRKCATHINTLQHTSVAATKVCAACCFGHCLKCIEKRADF